mmetsp:Transcript_29509/g.53537  ORF Transcript_29509/g.53537 Transcript_29509/m.53537 type:complete len:480 (-) Transcript_29509:148-1587(-)
MPQTTTTFKPAVGKKSRRRSTASSLSSITQLAFLASSCLLSDLPQTINAEPHSTIPRSNNRYTHYSTNNGDTSFSSSDSSSLSSLSSPQNPSTYHPPWNPSPKIDPHGFLSDFYPRSPGEWEPIANLRGRHGPRNSKRYTKLLNVPVQIRQVPGDGNCLFHSIAACLHHVENGTHLPMDSFECFGSLRSQSLQLRNAAVDVLQSSVSKGLLQRRLFLQGEEYLEAHELLSAAAAQFDLAGEEYCELMRKESYWGGGPEIVALCNYLQRPIHIYELIPAEEAFPCPSPAPNSNHDTNIQKQTSTQFTLRRMACFGSPKFDRREPLHILSADSRFPDIEPRRIRKVGNHFLALFPVTSLNDVGVAGGVRFRRHALIRGGSRVDGTSGRETKTNSRSGDGNSSQRGKNELDNDSEISERKGKWDGGLGSWTPDVMDWFSMDGDGMDYLEQKRRRNGGRKRELLLNLVGDYIGSTHRFHLGRE